LQCLAVCCSVLQQRLYMTSLSTCGVNRSFTYCSVLQGIAVCCRVLQGVTVRCRNYNTLQQTATHCNMDYRHVSSSFFLGGGLRHMSMCLWYRGRALQHTAAHCSALQHTAVLCSTMQHTETHCSTLQHTAAHCNTLQHTATHCNTLQHAAT